MDRIRALERELLQEEADRRRSKQTPERFIPHKPTVKQKQFLALDCFEALYGGAAGGGKSDALLMAALQYAHVPGYAALLLRRTYADLSLPGAIMDRSHTWLQGSGATWHDRDKRWTFPSGATLTFGYLDNERDRFRYQGAELQFIGFDELTQFPESWYVYLLSRLRRLRGVEVPLRARSASNPGGIGHDWVRRRFVDGASDSNQFVPATLADNPYLDADSYRQSLLLLDPTTRKQLLEGIWVRDAGGLVYKFSEEVNLVREIPTLSNYILGIDYGFNDSTAFCILGWRDHDPTVYITRCWKQSGLTPSAAAEIAHALERQYHFACIVGDTGGLGKGYAEEARARFNLPIQAAEKNNKRGYIDLLNGDLCDGRLKLCGAPVQASMVEGYSGGATGLLNGDLAESRPRFQGSISHGRPPTAEMGVAGGSCEALIKELLELPWNKERTKPEDGFEDHCCDALLYGWRACRAFLAEPTPVHIPEEDRLVKEIEERYIKKQKMEWWEQYE